MLRKGNQFLQRHSTVYIDWFQGSTPSRSGWPTEKELCMLFWLFVLFIHFFHCFFFFFVLIFLRMGREVGEILGEVEEIKDIIKIYCVKNQMNIFDLGSLQ